MRPLWPALPWVAGLGLLLVLPGSGALLAWLGAGLCAAATVALVAQGLRSGNVHWLDGALAATVATAALHNPDLGHVTSLLTALAALALCGWAHTLASAQARGPHVPLGIIARKAALALALAVALAAAVLLGPAQLAGLVSARWAASLDAHSVGLQGLAGLVLACAGGALLAARVALRRRAASAPPSPVFPGDQP
ncbi:MAG: hypothetical protein QOI63_470 [Thermoplasmata archaeon]|jgi:hypothetical protein|nr:hypothetical protein [Thermoplasmata archaeon]